MKGILAYIVAPLAAIGGLVAGLSLAVSKAWIPDHVAFYLWPSLIAFFLLVFALIALLRGIYLFLWPLCIGFLTQATGLVLLIVETIDDRWEPLWYTLIAIGIVLFIMFLVYVVVTVRARLLERKLAEGSGGSDEDTARIRNDMLEALEMLRRAGRGRNAIYELPWFLVMGRPAAGKTVAIKNSELGLPVKRDWVKGVGGTYTADWFFTNEMIFLDTPGKWVTEGANQDGQVHWRELVSLLRRYRGRQPLDGLIVVVPADDLMNLGESELEEQAANIREVIDLIHAELNFRFPIYLLVSKTDLVEGFVDFFKVLPPKRRHEILGWSNDDPNSQEVGPMIERGFKSLSRRLESFRIEMLAKVFKRTQARRLFFFAEEFKALEQPLVVFAEALFSGDQYSDSPVFRGFYFSSGTQEGAPLSKAVAQLARTLGVPATRAQEAEEGDTKRSYFLLDLFRELMVGDEGLVGRTAGHRWKLRRNTFLGAFAPAGIALVFLLLSLISFVRNNNTYSRIENNAATISQELATLQVSQDFGKTIQDRLAKTEELRRYHSQMVGLNLFRRFGMRRTGGLDADLYRLYTEEFRDAVLAPTLVAANDYALDADKSCVGRINVLSSVIWLRMGRRAGYDQLAGLDAVWGLDGSHQTDEARAVRQQFRKQYAHLKKHGGDVEEQQLLPGFDVRTTAKSIAASCGKQGAISSLAAYTQFQNQCRSMVTPGQIDGCWDQLREVFRSAKLDYAGFSKSFERLKNDLTELKAEVQVAETALDELGQIDLQHQETSQCLSRFDREYSPAIEKYAVKDDMLVMCQKRVEAESSRKAKYATRKAVLEEQEASDTFKLEEQALKLMFGAYTGSCLSAVDGFTGLDFDILRNTALSRRRLDCYRTTKRTVKAPPPRAKVARIVPKAPPRKTKAVTVSPPRVVSTPASPYEHFTVSCSVRRSYQPSSWDSAKGEWEAQLESTQAGFDDSQRAYEEDQVRGAIHGYGKNYAREWINYLQCIELRGQSGGSAAGWLRQLAESKEYELLIGRAKEAAALAESAGDGPFEGMKTALRPLLPVLELDLGSYQGLLGAVADDLQACSEDPATFRAYREGLRAQKRENSLIQAKDWVRRNAGASLLEGSLTELFRAPLATAEAFVTSDTLLTSQWGYLSDLYDQEIQARPPFGGDLFGEQALDFKTIKALLGGQTGAVVQVRSVAKGENLSREAAAWLERAEKLSALLFDANSDNPRSVKFKMELESVADKEFEKKRQLEQVKLEFGAGATFLWDEKLGTVNPVVRFPLLGEGASIFSVLTSKVAAKKMMLAPGKWKPAEGFDAVLAGQPGVKASAEGAFAPLKLMARGWTEPNMLRYALEIPKKKGSDNTYRIDLNFRISGEDVPRILDLIRNGLEAPPRSPK